MPHKTFSIHKFMAWNVLLIDLFPVDYKNGKRRATGTISDETQGKQKWIHSESNVCICQSFNDYFISFICLWKSIGIISEHVLVMP